MSEVTAIASGLFSGTLHYFSENIKLSAEPKRYRFVSFGAGISIAYFFLHLLPHTYDAPIHVEETVFIFLLLGFGLFHLSEKYIYQHIKQSKQARELKEIHSIIFFVSHFSVGIVSADKFETGILEGALFIFPAALHSGLSAASLSRIHGDIRENILIKTILSLSILLGVVFAILVNVPDILDNALVGFISGALLSIIVREFLPGEKKGRPLYFILGLVFFSTFNVIAFMI